MFDARCSVLFPILNTVIEFSLVNEIDGPYNILLSETTHLTGYCFPLYRRIQKISIGSGLFALK